MKILRYSLFMLGLGSLSLFLISSDKQRFWEIAKHFELFAKTYRTINTEYVERTDPNLLMRTAIDSMLGNMDPYTNFFSEAQMERLRIDVRGAWDGIGVSIARHRDQIVISEIIEGYPAQEQGLQVGDILLEIDGANIGKQEVEDLEKTLNGKAGTEVEIKVKRPSSGQERKLRLTRQKVQRKNVPYYDMLDEHTAYIVLTTFTEQAADNIAKALKELQEKHKPKQVILDLRDNGGGLLIEAVNICNLFIEKNLNVVTTRSKIPEWDRSFKTLNNPLDTRIPLVVLINKHSASASEIVGGALQDFDRAVLIGQKSFGKGLVQNTKDIGYNAKVKLTIAKYYIPSGRCIQALEYKDGRPMEIPDSLIKIFRTNNGRPVKDGGGLIPDLIIPRPEEVGLLKGLRDQHLIFDFANRFRNQNDSIGPAKSFKLPQGTFESFVTFVQEQGYTYECEAEKRLDNLSKYAQNQTFAQSLNQEIALLKQALEKQKAQDLQRERTAIEQALTEAIISRYHFEKGLIAWRLQQDPEVQAALKLFSDPAAYQALLQAKQ